MALEAKDILDRWGVLKGQRSTWDSFWQDIADYVMPRKGEITEKMYHPDTIKQDRLYDSTAIRANQVLANGQLTWMTPLETPWFAFEAPYEMKGDDEVDIWYQECTTIALLEMARSNFYSEIHELYLDRGCFGTAMLYCEAGYKKALHFECHEVGTYSIAEDDEKLVDTVYRDFEWTVRQIIQHFPDENIPDEVKKLAKEGKVDERRTIVHGVFPRQESDKEWGRRDAISKPFASIYIDKQSQSILLESGYDENPYMVTRYLRWQHSPYGYCPSWTALPDARQANFLEQHMDALAELQAFPRLLYPSGMEGTVDLRAAGVTYFDAHNPQAKPEEWGTQGRYDIGLDRSERKRKAINDAYHVDLFQMFSNTDKEMTAREVGERASEKLIQFSPTFARMTTELYNPLLSRVFGLLLRQGKFPEPPEGVIVESAEGLAIQLPEVGYSSRIALAIKGLENNALFRQLEMIMPILQLDQSVADNYDFDTIVREASRNDGLPPNWMKKQDEVQKIREKREAQLQKQMEAEQAAQSAQAIQSVGNVPPENLANVLNMAGAG